jgi:multidrug efflux pump subunit AcrA (membrane-fusion protein)
MGLSKKKWYRNHSLLKRISAGFVFVICVIAAVYWGVGRNAQAQSETGETYYTVVKRGDIRVSASGSGTLEASNQISLSFPTAGIVSEVNVTVGDTVRAGDVLARIGDTTELEANLAAAKLNLVEVQQSYMPDRQRSGNIAAAYQAYAERRPLTPRRCGWPL